MSYFGKVRTLNQTGLVCKNPNALGGRLNGVFHEHHCISCRAMPGSMGKILFAQRFVLFCELGR